MLFKQRKFPWHVHKYPLVKSLIPPAVPYAVFTGELHRARTICKPGNATKDDFVEAATKIGVKLVGNGCEHRVLVSKMKAFVYTKFSRDDVYDGRLTVKAHREGTIRRFDRDLRIALQKGASQR